MLSILKRFVWPLNELESEEELKKKKSPTDPESFYTAIANPLATQASLLAKNEREERELLTRQEYWSALFDLWD